MSNTIVRSFSPTAFEISSNKNSALVPKICKPTRACVQAVKPRVSLHNVYDFLAYLYRTNRKYIFFSWQTNVYYKNFDLNFGTRHAMRPRINFPPYDDSQFPPFERAKYYYRRISRARMLR